MRNPDDTRDVVPRFGSPPWIYITAVSIAGAAVLGLSVTFLPTWSVSASPGRQPMFWVVAGMILVAEIWPLATPGRRGSDSPAISRTLTLAVLLFWGFAIAVLLRAAAIVLVGLARHSPHRVAFNAAQVSLSMGAAELVLLARRIPQASRRLRMHARDTARCRPAAGGPGLLRRQLLPGHGRDRPAHAHAAQVGGPCEAAVPGSRAPGPLHVGAARRAGHADRLGDHRRAARLPARSRVLQRGEVRAARPSGQSRRADRSAQPQAARQARRRGAGQRRGRRVPRPDSC